MNWTEVVFLALFLHLGLLLVVSLLYRAIGGDSPHWEVASFSAIVLWLITVAIRIMSDLVGNLFPWSGTVVQVFFLTGAFEVGFFYICHLGATLPILSPPPANPPSSPAP